MVVIDTNVLVYMINPKAPSPTDPTTGKQVEHVKERVEHLVATLQEKGIKVLVPTPVLSELLLVNRKKYKEILEVIRTRTVFRPVSFDQRAAIELAINLEDAKVTQNLNVGLTSKAKLRFDRQIIAIACAQGVKVIYSDDANVCSLATRKGMRAYGIKDMDLPAVNLALF
ncbi:PIN domain-containing protein [Neptunomonas japonica]|uniref:PIN domain-containing protein n=1 Tax=Neptunomonas japonica TaxID=417574 RepID=UPI00068431FE|nr:PIN domain-containing protein [Neptunomonas japonica]